MDSLFALCLTEHGRWGYVLTPYMLAPVTGEDYFLIRERLTQSTVAGYKNVLTETHEKIIRRAGQYSEKEIIRIFQGKTGSREFMQSLTEEFIRTQIRPYIERRLLYCFDLLHGSDVRIFFRDNPDRVYFTQEIFHDETPAEAIFNFRYGKTEGLRYFLSVSHRDEEIKLKGKRLISLVSQPSVMVLENRLVRFGDIDSKKLLPFTTKDFIAIPKTAEEKYFNSFVLESVRKYKVNASGFRLEDEQSDPAAALFLENDLRCNPALVLRFDYENGYRPFDADLPHKTGVTIHKTGEGYTVKRFRRNREREEYYFGLMRQTGLYYAGNSMFYASENAAKVHNPDYQSALAELIEKLNFISGDLTDNGFRIVQQSFPEKYFTGAFHLRITVNEKTDWFDIRAAVQFGGFKIPFVSFRNHIIRQIRNYVLPNGEIMILPSEWFAKYSQAMLMSEQKDENLQIHKHHFTVVADSFDSGSRPRMKNLMRLCEFAGTENDMYPASVQAVLRPYQLQGFNWLRALHEHHLGGCLADDMGLGKTLQTLCLLQWLADADSGETAINAEPCPTDNERDYVQLSLFDAHTGVSREAKEIAPVKAETGRASLLVMPASLIHNWVNEISRFTPSLGILIYAGADRRKRRSFGKYHIVLTTYGVLRNDLDILSGYRFHYLILDEAQYVKNPDSASYHAVLQIQADHYLSLSGTPVENSLTDLWAQMNFLNRGLLGSPAFFREHYSNPIEKDNDENCLARLQRLIRPFLLRRTKKEVEPDLPDLTEQNRYCEMNKAQHSLYEEEKSKARNQILESIDEYGVAKSGMLIIRALSRLRQLAIHPAMLDEEYASGSGKFDRITEDMEILRNEGHRVLLFSSFTKHLDLIAAYLREQSIPYSLLTGKTRNRESIIHEFQNSPDIPFFLISLKAGGVGLNLTAADYVFLLDPWWNPAVEQQAISRAHRIGQKQKVFAYRMITTGSIEEKIIQLQEKKSILADAFVQSGNPFRNMTPENVMELFS
jgi:superfamily II DNA or RNA helicase